MKVGFAGTGRIVREFLEMQKTQERIEVTSLVCRPGVWKKGGSCRKSIRSRLFIPIMKAF
ncbi:MAG: hypothetical protein V8S22_07400 [Lachnospiraceae bacterium]